MLNNHGDDEDEDGDEEDDEGDDDDDGVDDNDKNDVNYNMHAFGFYKSHAGLALLNRACVWIY